MVWSITASATQADSSSNPVVMAFDCNGADFLVLFIGSEDFPQQRPRSGGAPTYGGVAMTDCGQGIVLSGGTGNEAQGEIWVLANPAAGANNISIPNSDGIDIVPVAVAGTGCNTADPLDASGENHNAGSINPTVSVTTGGSGKLTINGLCTGASTVPDGNSHTLITVNDNGAWCTGAQYTTNDLSGGGNMSWPDATSDDWVCMWVSLNEAGGGPAHYDRTVTFGIGITTGLEREANYARAVSFGIGISTAASRLAAYARSASFGIGITTSASRLVSFMRSASFSIGISTALSRSVSYLRTIPFGIGIATSISKAGSYARTISFGIGITVSVSRAQALSRLISFGIGIITTARAILGLPEVPIDHTSVEVTVPDKMVRVTVPYKSVQVSFGDKKVRVTA